MAKSNFTSYRFASQDGRQNQILHSTDLHLRMVGRIKFYILPICIWGWSGDSNFISYQFASKDGRSTKPNFISYWFASEDGQQDQISYLTDLHQRMLGKKIFYILPRSIQGWSAKLNYSYLTTLHPKSNCQISWQKEYISSLFFLRRSAKFNFLYLVCNIFWMSTFKILNQRRCDETPQPRLQWQNRRLGVLIQKVRSAFFTGCFICQMVS